MLIARRRETNPRTNQSLVVLPPGGPCGGPALPLRPRGELVERLVVRPLLRAAGAPRVGRFARPAIGRLQNPTLPLRHEFSSKKIQRILGLRVSNQSPQGKGGGREQGILTGRPGRRRTEVSEATATSMVGNWEEKEDDEEEDEKRGIRVSVGLDRGVEERDLGNWG